MFALLLPVLVLIVGLVLEAGMMMAAQAELQAISNASARVVALAGTSDEPATEDTAQEAMEAYLAEVRSMCSRIDYEIHQPPQIGPFAGQDGYVEVVITGELPSSFGGVLGGEDGFQISTRSVVGWVPVSSGARLVTLDRDASPGLKITGSGDVIVHGGVIVNSQAGGQDRHGDEVPDGENGVAAQVGGLAQLYADDVQVSGGVNDPEGFLPLDPEAAPPLRTFCTPIADPFADLPVPTISLGVVDVDQGSVQVSQSEAKVSGDNQVRADGVVELNPGLYSEIRITGGRVLFRPGIYVLRSLGKTALTINGGDVVSEGGILFYKTTPGYDPNTGMAWDAHLDTSTQASIIINQAARLQPLDTGGGPLDGLLIFQSRGSRQSIRFQGQSDVGRLGGTIYSESGSLEIAGQGVVNCQAVVGRFLKSGNGTLEIDTTLPPPTIAKRVFQVE
jgi:hypothetical protein